MESLVSYKNNGNERCKGRILSPCGNHPNGWIQHGYDLEKAVVGDDVDGLMDLKWLDANRVVAHLVSKLWK